MKKNNTLKVLLIAILFTFLLTWLLPISYYSGGLYTDSRYPTGLFDIFNYPTLTFYYFGQIAVYVLVVGAFYGIFEKTGVYRKVCDKIVKLFKGKENIFFIAVITLLSVIVSICGFSYELIFLLPLLTSIILLMGYDKITVAMTLIGSIAVGFLGSTYASSITGTYMSTLATNYSDLIWFRVIMLVLGIAILSLNIIFRNKKVDVKNDEGKELIPENLKDEGKEITSEKYEEKFKKVENKKSKLEKLEVKTKKRRVKASWPAIVIFDVILLVMIVGAFDLSGAFGVEIFEKFHESVMSFTIFGYDIFAKILGSTMQTANLGTWTTVEFTTIILIASLVLSLIYRVKLNDIFTNYKEGAKKFALSALLMILAYTVMITTANHPVILTIIKPLMSITDGFNSVTLSLSMFIGSIFNIDVYYTSSALLPYITSVITDTSLYPLVGFISQAMQGLALLIAPTSIVLLGVISYLKVNYTEWVKNIWKLFLELLVIAFILFTIILII